MEKGNNTQFKYFLLQGFGEFGDFRFVLITLFLFAYLLTLGGNMLIIFVIYSHANLHTPMYYFITHLSLLEMWYISTTVPKLLSLLLTSDKRISFEFCFAQLYMFHGLGITECWLLGVMAFDRCNAICKPLKYSAIMHTRRCNQLALICWSSGFLSSAIPMTLTLKLPFCGPNNINHYFCDLAPLMDLACIDTSLNQTINKCVICIINLACLFFIILMYLLIIVSIMKIRSIRGRLKAFSTCSSHLTVVVLFFGTAFIVYVSPKGAHSMDYDKFFALVYAMFIPFLNPFIYSLRNQEVKMAIKKDFQILLQYIFLR
ncbi:olfactory receptor 6N2-like [Bombina bombina]|uniref:olfactory receptor 6N2-like n=1 Tax=Bombina bombina TaxID=8345 RepID=UPI00235A638D|nr:olfactory receptor 6N2-like [Bombina bombina]